MLRTFFVFTAVLLGVRPLSAWAETNCLAAKDLVNMVQSFYRADADRIDIIKPEFNLQLKPIGDNPAPTGLRYVYEDQEIDLLIDEEGNVQGMEKASSFKKDGELCKLIDGEIGEKTKEPTVQANMSFSFPYLNKTGSHSVDELVEGAKDGSKIMNSLAPGGMGFMVPGLKAIIVSPAEKDGDMPVLRFMEGDTLTRGPEITRVKNNQLFKVKDLKKS
ncbi:hypothetical protein [Litorimonas haliclonae]|uniref:hypothetical protein n=1 Tax=Litorimonas haliclonae TaxID=2081977 RepID=UPI0039EFEB62